MWFRFKATLLLLRIFRINFFSTILDECSWVATEIVTKSHQSIMLEKEVFVYTAQKEWNFWLKVSSKNVKLRIWLHLLKKPSLENFSFCSDRCHFEFFYRKYWNFFGLTVFSCNNYGIIIRKMIKGYFFCQENKVIYENWI